MSVAVFSRNETLSRMLLLEAKRCGLREEAPAAARVWLLDLDALPSLPSVGHEPLRVGFSTHPQESKKATRLGLYALLELPFSARERDELLHRHATLPHGKLVYEGETIWLGEKKLHFSKTEQKILDLLLKNASRTVSVQEVELVLGEKAENSNAVAVYLYRLRRKLEQDGITRIRTVRGVGYQWIGD